MGGRSHFSGNIGLRDGLFFHGKNGNASIAIQDKQETSFVALDNYRDTFAIALESGEERRGGGIVVPEVVVHELESPDEFSGLTTKGDDGIGPLVVSRTETAVIIGTGAASGDEDEVTFGINNHDRPGVGCAGAPGFGGGLRR